MFRILSFEKSHPITLRFFVAGLLCTVGSSFSTAKDHGHDHDEDQRAIILVEQALRAEINGQFADRDELLQEATKSKKDFGPANWYRGMTLDEKGQWQEIPEVVDAASNNQLLAEYEKLRSNLNDNESDNWMLANWCATNQLNFQCRAHLERVLKLNPKHQAARRALGHQMINGEWISTAEIALLQQRSERAWEGNQRYGKKIDTLMNRISNTGPRGRAVAYKLLVEISDPLAIPVVESLGSAYSIHTCEAAVQWLGQIDDPEASRALARFAIFHPNDSVRNSASTTLKQKPLYDFVPEVLAMLQGSVQVMTVPSFDSRGNILGFRQAFAQEEMDERNLIVVDRIVSRGDRTTGAPVNPLTPQEIFTNKSINRLANKTIAKEMQDLHQEAINNAAQINAAIEQRNVRIANLLSQITERNFVSNINEVWSWWDSYNESYSQNYKPERYDYTSLEYRIPQIAPSFRSAAQAPSTGPTRSGECFVAGTPVMTIRGLRPIETILVGDIVLSREVPTGALQWKPVLTPTTRPPDSTFELSFNDESITCTPGHLLWVSGAGWKKARDIKAGDILHGASQPVVVTQNFATAVHPTYNLEIADNGTYFVGKSMILSHDVTARRSSREIVPGLRDLTVMEKTISENLPPLVDWVVVWK